MSENGRRRGLPARSGQPEYITADRLWLSVEMEREETEKKGRERERSSSKNKDVLGRQNDMADDEGRKGGGGM